MLVHVRDNKGRFITHIKFSARDWMMIQLAMQSKGMTFQQFMDAALDEAVKRWKSDEIRDSQIP